MISIHAPAWGATRAVDQRFAAAAISIHAPAWGATSNGGSRWSGRRYFNSRPRVGGDSPISGILYSPLISIHAPAWGATRPGAGPFSPRPGFQFTPPRGGRPRTPRRRLTPPNFNSRPRVGGDKLPWPRSVGHPHFNSRPRVGGDEILPLAIPDEPISIHAPAWGATACLEKGPETHLFQFTPPRGGRPYVGLISKGATRISIHAPAWGATRTTTIDFVNPLISIHAPAWGGDGVPISVPDIGNNISIHAPAWGATWMISQSTPICINFNSRPRVGGDTETITITTADHEFQFTPPRGGRPIGWVTTRE